MILAKDPHQVGQQLLEQAKRLCRISAHVGQGRDVLAGGQDRWMVRSGVHYPDGTADRTAKPSPVVPTNMRGQQRSSDRHTVASLLKALHVPARDAQVILGHSRLAVTLEIYTQTDDEAQLDALTRLHNLFDQG